MNMSLKYLVTEEIEEQDLFTDRWTDSRTTEERVSHKLDWSSTSSAKIVFIFTFLIQFDSLTKIQ